MLDFSVLVQQLTQGQAPAEMTVLQTPQPGSGPAPESAAQQAPASAAPAPSAAANVDARVIAERVYELMRRDLLIQKERRAH